MSDVIMALIMSSFLYVAIVTLLPSFSSVDHSLYETFVYFIPILFSICYLNRKYPVNFSLKIDYKLFCKFVLPIAVICFLLNYNGQGLTEDYNLFIKKNTVDRVVFLLTILFYAPLLEEWLFRGLVYKILRNKYDIAVGTVVTAALFQIAHLNLSGKSILFSLAFTYVYEKTGTIWASILVHFIANIAYIMSLG